MSSIKPGKVEWTGDNPFIYLKTDPTGDWSTLALYFRIATSDYGRGHAILVLENPYEKEDANATRILLTDNLALSHYLVDNFVRHFGLFRKATALDTVKYIDDAVFSTNAEYPQKIIESAISASTKTKVELVWNDLQQAIAVDLPASETQTNKHEMMCVFQPALSAQILVNGVAIPGKTVERDFMGTRAQSASLANSETWVCAT